MGRKITKEDFIVEREYLSDMTAEEFVIRIIRLLIIRDTGC